MKFSQLLSHKYFRVILLLTIVFTTMSFNIKPGESIVIIVNSKNPVSALTISQTRDIYLRKDSKRWKDLNTNIIPLDVRGDTESKSVFLVKVLKMTKIEMYRYFSEREYQNQEQQPVRIASEEDIIKFVQENPGSIGYVSSTIVEGKPNIKVICTVE